MLLCCCFSEGCFTKIQIHADTCVTTQIKRVVDQSSVACPFPLPVPKMRTGLRATKHTELHKQPKMRTYCQFKRDFIMELYLSKVKSLPSRIKNKFQTFRSSLAKRKSSPLVHNAVMFVVFLQVAGNL